MAQKRVLSVAAADPRQLGAFLRARLGSGDAEVRALLREGAVYVDRRREQQGDAALPIGARVHVYLSASLPVPPLAPRIVYQDADVLVLDKPAGLLSQPGPTGGPSLLGWLEARGERAYLLHRLDRDASGLLLLARRKAACAELQRALEAGHIERRYLAVVAGAPRSPEGTIDLRIAADARDRRRRVALPTAAPGGEAATTRYRTERALPDGRALLLLTLLSGRTHQIRVHLAALGHPIVGDREYGGTPAARLLLHAAELRFRHPGTGQQMTHRSPPPPGFLPEEGPQ